MAEELFAGTEFLGSSVNIATACKEAQVPLYVCARFPCAELCLHINKIRFHAEMASSVLLMTT